MFSDDLYPPSIDYVSQSLCARQPCSLQIIQLVECSPPPPQHKYSPSWISSSAYSDEDDSAYDSSSSSPSLSAGDSYCSSIEDSPPSAPPSFDNRDPSIDDTYRTRQRRVSLWRDAVYCSKNAPYSARPASPSQKRKTPDSDLANNDSITSHTPRKSSRSTLSAHSCPACDEDFSSPLSLRQHASASKSANEACRIAVEYGFE